MLTDREIMTDHVMTDSEMKEIVEGMAIGIETGKEIGIGTGKETGIGTEIEVEIVIGIVQGITGHGIMIGLEMVIVHEMGTDRGMEIEEIEM